MDFELHAGVHPVPFGLCKALTESFSRVCYGSLCAEYVHDRICFPCWTFLSSSLPLFLPPPFFSFHFPFPQLFRPNILQRATEWTVRSTPCLEVCQSRIKVCFVKTKDNLTHLAVFLLGCPCLSVSMCLLLSFHCAKLMLYPQVCGE